MQNKSGFIIISLFCVLTLSGLNAQTKTTTSKEKSSSKEPIDTIQVPLYQGIRVELDLSPAVNYFLNKGERLTYEGAVSVNLKNKYFPTLEMGYGYADKISDEGVGFKSKSPFARIGVDINLLKQAKGQAPSNNLFYAGVRLGMAPVKYSYSNIVVTDEYWGTSQTINFNDQQSFSKWYEVLLGVRVEIAPRVYMGWTARLKNTLGDPKLGKVFPWYIPGYGVKTDQSIWSFNYSIGYKF